MRRKSNKPQREARDKKIFLPRVWERAEVLRRTAGPTMFLGSALEAVWRSQEILTLLVFTSGARPRPGKPVVLLPDCGELPAPWLPGEVEKGPIQFQTRGSGTKPSTSDLKTVGTSSSPSCCKVPPGTSWSFLRPSPIPPPPSFSTSPGALGWEIGHCASSHPLIEGRSDSVSADDERRWLGVSHKSLSLHHASRSGLVSESI